MSIEEVSERIESELNKELPGFDWRITNPYYNLGPAIRIRITGLPPDFKLYKDDYIESVVQNQPAGCNPYAEQACDILELAGEIAKKHNESNIFVDIRYSGLIRDEEKRREKDEYIRRNN